MVRHNGTAFEKMVRKSGYSVLEIAKMLKVSRRSMYHWFKKPDLSADLILTVSKMLGCELSKDFESENSGKIIAVTDHPKASTKGGDSRSEMQVWMNKYASLLEKYTYLLERERRLINDLLIPVE